MPKILVVDDEEGIRNLVKAYLEKENYQVVTAADGIKGLQAARTLKPDLIVLDIMLPGMDGLAVLNELRKDSNVYVIMLTARADEIDKVVGLSIGADDYLTKPFSPRELVARVKAALRRLQPGVMAGSAQDVLAFPHLKIDTASREVWVDGQPIELTAIEFNLLVALARHSRIVLSREQLLEMVWGASYYGESRVVDVHVGNLRRKLGQPDLIVTVRGVGYRFSKEVD